MDIFLPDCQLFVVLSAGFDVVYGLGVASEFDFFLEGFFAQVARERFHAGVFAHVRDQVGALRKRFAAHAALVRLFTWKNVLVLKFVVKKDEFHGKQV